MYSRDGRQSRERGFANAGLRRRWSITPEATTWAVINRYTGKRTGDERVEHRERGTSTIGKIRKCRTALIWRISFDFRKKRWIFSFLEGSAN